MSKIVKCSKNITVKTQKNFWLGNFQNFLIKEKNADMTYLGSK